MALLLCEGWAGEGGDANFNPVTEFSPSLNISTSSGPGAPGGFTQLGSYKVVVENVTYYATLSWKASGSSGLKAINVLLKWDQNGRPAASLAKADKTYQLTTYAKKAT